MREESNSMKNDPFGNLCDWGTVLDILEELSVNGQLSDCQSGLIRVLRYKGNWRLREEVLKRIGKIRTPSPQLILQTLSILTDDNIYYDARILAGEAILQILKNTRNNAGTSGINMSVRKAAVRLISTPQPPVFETAVKNLLSET